MIHVPHLLFSRLERHPLQTPCGVYHSHVLTRSMASNKFFFPLCFLFFFLCFANDVCVWSTESSQLLPLPTMVTTAPHETATWAATHIPFNATQRLLASTSFWKWKKRWNWRTTRIFPSTTWQPKTCGGIKQQDSCWAAPRNCKTWQADGRHSTPMYWCFDAVSWCFVYVLFVLPPHASGSAKEHPNT